MSAEGRCWQNGQQNGHNPMTSSPLHKQRDDQGLEFNEEEKSWYANKVFKFERTNFREATWTGTLICGRYLEFLPDRDNEPLWQWGETPGICRKELHAQKTNATFTNIFKIGKQTKNCERKEQSAQKAATQGRGDI